MARMREGGSGRKPLGEIKASPSPKVQIDRVIGELREIKKALPGDVQNEDWCKPTRCPKAELPVAQ